MVNSGFLVCTGNNVLLPGETSLKAATLKINRDTGKIVEISLGRKDPHQESNVEWIDAGDKFVLPGLVECVLTSLL
jgi:allantoinase